MRIVIADDSAVVRQRLARELAALRGVVIVGQADDSPQAKEMVQHLRPDVAILDIRMPSGSGADLIPEIKQLEPAPTVIMLTNYPYPENQQKCLRNGADFFFDKSTEFQKVASVLKQLAGLSGP